MHDAANSIATIVSTRVLKPQYAVLWAAFFNFAAFFIFKSHVASTVGKGIVTPELIDNAVVFGALTGAISWNLITWYFGIPSSSSHTLIGGIIGAGVAKAGFGSIVWRLSKTLYAIVLSPVTGFLLGILFMILVSWLFVRANPTFATIVAENSSSFLPRSIRLAMVQMTRKRRRELSRSCCTRMASTPISHSAELGYSGLLYGDGPRHHAWRLGELCTLWVQR